MYPLFFKICHFKWGFHPLTLKSSCLCTMTLDHLSETFCPVYFIFRWVKTRAVRNALKWLWHCVGCIWVCRRDPWRTLSSCGRKRQGHFPFNVQGAQNLTAIPEPPYVEGPSLDTPVFLVRIMPKWIARPLCCLLSSKAPRPTSSWTWVDGWMQ